MFRIVSAAIMVTCVCSSAQEQRQVTLKQNFKPGHYTVTHELDSQGSTTMGEQSMRQASTMTMVMDIGITGTEDNVTKVEMQFTRIAQSFSQNGQELMSYDSQTPQGQEEPPSPLASIYGPLLETKISFEITPEGTVRNVTGLDELWDRIAQDNPQLAPLAQQMKRQFGSQLFENLIVQGSDFYPDKPVSVGESWQTQTKIEAPVVGSLSVNQDITLKEIQPSPQGELAILDIIGTANVTEPQTMSMGETSMTLTKMDLEQTSDMKMLVETGMVVEQHATGKVETAMTMQNGEGQTADVSSTQEFTGVTTITPAEQVD